LEKTTVKTAPFANATLISGVLAFILSLFPWIVESLVIIPFMIVYFIVPIFAFTVGVLAVIFSFLAKNKLNKAWNKTDHTLEKMSGRWKVVVGMILGFISILVGGFIAAVFFYFTQEMKATPTEPIGESQMYFYGEEEYNEISTQTILLPDSTLLTKGHRYIRHLTGSRSSVLLKTDLNGKEIWFRPFSGKNGIIAKAADNTLLFAYMMENINVTSDNVIRIQKLSLEGDSLDSRNYKFNCDRTTIQLFKAVDQKMCLMGVGIAPDSGEFTEYSLIAIDSAGDSLWSKTYSKELTGNMQDIVVVDDGYVITGWIGKEFANDYSYHYLHIDKDGNILADNRDDEPFNFQIIETLVNEDGTIMVLGNQVNEAGSLNGLMRKMKPNGEIIWSKPFSGDGYHFTTGFIPWKGGWLVTGWTPRQTSMMTMKTQKVEAWDTWYIAILNADGELIHGFNGEKESFAAWDITAISEDRCVMTGFGGDKTNANHKYSANDIGLLFYK